MGKADDPRKDSNLRRFAGNAFWMLVAKVGVKGASLVFVIILARALGTEQYGYFNFAVSFVSMFLILGGWGLELALIREVARDRDRLSLLFASGLALRTVLGLVGLLISALCIQFFVGQEGPVLALAIVGSALFLDELTSFLGAVFKAFERSALYALVMLANRALSTCLAAVALILGAGLTFVAVTYFLGSLGALAFAWGILYRKFPPIQLRDVRWSVMKTLWRHGTPLGIASFLTLVAFRIDMVMLQAISGPVAVAMYGVSYRFLESFLFVTWSFSTAILPRMARAQHRRETARVYQLTVALKFMWRTGAVRLRDLRSLDPLLPLPMKEESDLQQSSSK